MWESLKELAQVYLDWMVSIYLSMIAFFKDFFFWILEQIMTIAIGMLDLVGQGLTDLNPLSYINAIPSETKALMAMSGFNESMGILITALSIRIVIQLIPFVRWGS